MTAFQISQDVKEMFRAIVDDCNGDYLEAAAELREQIRLVSDEAEYRAVVGDELARLGIDFDEHYERVRRENGGLSALLDTASDEQLADWLRELLRPSKQ